MAKVVRLQSNSRNTKSVETWKDKPTGNNSRVENDLLRGRKHMLAHEIDEVCKVVKAKSRNALRDELIIQMCYRHGLRVTEVTNLQWQHIDLETRQIQINRIKRGINNTHPLASKRELMLLTRLYKAKGKPRVGYVFITERETIITKSTIQKMFSSYSEKALGIKWNIHALRHSCGTELVTRDTHLVTTQHFLGQRNIKNTEIYVHMAANQFDGIAWD